MWIRIVGLLLLGIPLSLPAEVLAHHSLVQEVGYWQTFDESLDIEEASARVFRISTNHFINIGQDNQVHWIRLVLEERKERHPVIIEADCSYIDEFEVFVPTAPGLWQHFAPVSDSLFASRRFTAVPVQIEPDHQVVYLRITGKRKSQVRFRAFSPAVFRDSLQWDAYFFYGGFSLLTVIMAFVFGFLFYARRTLYFWLGLTLVFACLYIYAVEGFWLDYLLLLNPSDNERLQNVSSGLLFFSMLRFTRYWLQSHAVLPDMDLFTRLVEWLNVLLAVMSFFLPGYLFEQVCYLNALFSSVLVFFLLLLRRAHGVRELGFAVSGTYLGMMGFLMMVLRLYDVVAISFLNLHSIALGLTVQFVFLSFSVFQLEIVPRLRRNI